MNDPKLDISERGLSMDTLIQVLETPPSVSVPPDFSRRVLQRLPRGRHPSAGSRARALSPRYGTAAALLAIAVLLAAVMLLPSHAATPGMQTGSLLLLSADMVALVLGLFVLRWRSQ